MLVALGPSFPCMRKQLARGNSWRFYRSYRAGSSSGFELFRKPGAWNNNKVRRSAVRGLHTVDRFVTYPLCIRLSIVSFYMILNKFDYMPTGDKSGEQAWAHGIVRSDTLQQRGRHSYRKAGIFEFRRIFHLEWRIRFFWRRLDERKNWWVEKLINERGYLLGDKMQANIFCRYRSKINRRSWF